MSDCLTPTQQYLAMSWREQVNFQLNGDEVRFVHIILIPRQPVFALSP